MEKNVSNKKIGIVMWYDENIKEYADITSKINTMYCKKYNIDFITSHEKTYSPHLNGNKYLLFNFFL